jgi:hypothetical protein
MVPILTGRFQTRIFVLAVIGSLTTLIVTPFLPPHSAPLGDRYQATFTTLAVVLVLGLGWDCLYYFLQQFRWEKDWPTLYGFLTGINEGIAAWLVVSYVTLPGHPPPVTGTAFVIDFTAVWIASFLFVNGPMRVVSIRWRFRGGRLV